MRRLLRGLRSRLHFGPCLTEFYAHRRQPVPRLSAPQGFRTAWLEKEEISRLREIGPVDEALTRRRLERGDRCLIGFLQDQPVHYSWVQVCGEHSIQSARRRVMVRPGERWIYDCYTARSARGKGIYPYALTVILRESAGVSVSWIYVLRRNQASVKGIRRAGFEPVGTQKSFRLGPWFLPLGGGQFDPSRR